MHLRVAIQAGSSLGDVGGAFAQAIGIGRCGAGYLPADQLRDEAAVRGMALVAEERRTHFQHAFCDRAMWVMAVRAIFADGFVVMHKRTAFFGVALVTGGDNAVTLHKLWPDRAVDIVAIGTRNLAFQNRVVRRSTDLGTLFLVAGKTDFKLGRFAQHFVFRDMQRVTVGTTHVARLVGAALPM